MTTLAAGVRVWLIILGAVAAVVVAVGAAVALISRDRGQGVVPDRIQRAAREAVDRGPPAKPIAPARCPAGLVGCRVVSGRIVYVESVDPDGDGDAHFVLADPASVTGPGFSVVDVRVGLRPNPLPSVGAQVSAAGTIETGSYGQSQIEAVSFESG